MEMKVWSLKKVKKELWPWSLSDFKWKKPHFQLQKISIVDDLLFRILSVFEAIVLVSTLCFFFLCCGCHF
ncbi:hypothetical protein HYC85_007684 [Camellia sinensis]|uniref:Uncharacterized protein n=1 Tax=Camellia sinensis TaxID=4442 RepID=A0A7J7HS32_CAMSI|nr:hypothetical protein HYC85_007684 [Camellia sinensis]